MCPVTAAASIIRRLQREHATDDTFLYEYKRKDDHQGQLTTTAALKLLRHFISTINHTAYGLEPTEIGLHSLRSSAAMAMYLNGIPVYTIMLLGRWSSDAFLRYIRKQVEEFGHDVSRKMIQTPRYHHVPNADSNDPRSHNPLSTAANLGMGRHRTTDQNAFSVWN
jgi:integrase